MNERGSKKKKTYRQLHTICCVCVYVYVCVRKTFKICLYKCIMRFVNEKEQRRFRETEKGGEGISLLMVCVVDKMTRGGEKI